MLETINLGNGLCIKMDMMAQSPRPFSLMAGDVMLVHGDEFGYDRSLGSLEFPVTYYAAPSEKAFIDDAMNKFRADRAAKRQAEIAEFMENSERGQLDRESAAILAIRKLKGATNG